MFLGLRGGAEWFLPMKDANLSSLNHEPRANWAHRKFWILELVESAFSGSRVWRCSKAEIRVGTVDGRNPAPHKKPWNDYFPVNNKNKQRLRMVLKWCRVFVFTLP